MNRLDIGGFVSDVKNRLLLILTMLIIATFSAFSDSSLIIADDIDDTVVTDNGNRKTGISPSGTLPVIYINVYQDNNLNFEFDDEIIDRNLNHKNYFNGFYWMEVPEGFDNIEPVGSKESPLSLKIKARGNFTFTAFSKKSYKLKLSDPQNLLGLTIPGSRHYALLAHADDKYSYLRNFTGFELGKMIGLPWVPSSYPVEVVINDDYRGIYFLTESVRVEEGRIDIEPLEDKCEIPDYVSGGYVVELDYKREENQIVIDNEHKFDTEVYYRPLMITFSSPEKLSGIQKEFISNQFEYMNMLISSGSDEMWSYIDIDDAVRYYIVCELLGHSEAFHGSTFMHRDRGENQKWHYSPLWDLGQSFNEPVNTYICSETCAFGYTWWLPEFRENERFSEKVRNTWNWFITTHYSKIWEKIDTFLECIADAAKQDSLRWKDAPLPDSKNVTYVVDNSDIYSGFNMMAEYLNNRVDWLSNEFGLDWNEIYEEPERDSLSEVEASDSLESTLYYNLLGMKVNNPTKGEIYIKISSKGRHKIIF